MSFTNLRHLLETRAVETPDKLFLISEADGREWTYAEFDRIVNRTANLLISNGITKGDVVSLLMPNSPEYIVAYFACWKIGAIAGPVNSLLKAEEIEWVVNNSESKLMLTSERSAVAGGSSRDRTRPACVSAEHENGLPPTIDFGNIETATADFPDTLAETTINTDDEAIIIYTSGTTGKPKGCLLTHGNLLANAEQITNWMGFGADDRLLTIMPLFHMNAVTVTTITALFCGGSTVVSPKFSASRFWNIIERYQITSFGSVATMLSMLLAKSVAPASAGDQDSAAAQSSPPSKGGVDAASADGVVNGRHASETQHSLRFAMCGSAPVPAEILKRFEETFGILVIEGYGLSESTCRSTFNPPNENRRPGSCGMPIGNEMKVFDEEDNEVPDGELGEIVLRGPNIFKAYFKNPDATAKAFANGWFHTGDIGYRDTDGFFYIADRKSDMIIRGGENIYPREIDDLLYTHPAVAHAAVIGVPDDLYGEEVTAFIVLKEGFIGRDNLAVDPQSEIANRKSPDSPPYEGGVDAASADGVVLLSVTPAVAGGFSQPIEPSDTDQANDTVHGSSPYEGGVDAASADGVVLSSYSNVTPDDIIDFCKLHLADYKCPKTVHFVDDIPKGPTGKLLKRELARLLLESRTK